MTSQTQTNRLFVSGLPYRFSEGELLRLFVKFGRVIDARIIFSRWGKSRGMGYVEFDKLEDAIKAKTEMHNFKLTEDRHIIVDFAKVDPLTTDEGKQRFAEAQKRRPKRKDVRKLEGHVRDTVYKQRNFGSKIGKKFAKKSKKG